MKVNTKSILIHQSHIIHLIERDDGKEKNKSLA